MPTLKAARRLAANAPVQADFGSVWSVVDSQNVSYEGQGLYAYVGAGSTKPEDVGLIRTKFPLDCNRKGGIASFEITLTDMGESILCTSGTIRIPY